MNKRGWLTGMVTGVLVMVSGWFWFSPEELDQAPQVTFRITDGRQISLQKLQGRPVLVTFWATSCPGCIREMPHLVALYDEFSGKGLEIIGVAMSYDPPSHVMKMIENRQIPYPVSLDPDGTIAQSFNNVMLTPNSFLIAPDGTIVKHKVGEMDMESLRKQINTLLSQKQLATSNRPLVTNSS